MTPSGPTPFGIPSVLSVAGLILALCAGAGCAWRQAGVGTPLEREASIRAQPGLVAQDFVFTASPTAMCHAATIAEVDGALVAAWFGGAHEKDSGVVIWTSRRQRGEGWSAPRQVADGVVSPSERHACWNPVLCQPARGPLLLFYKVGPSPRTWWGMKTTSPDGGVTWTAPERLPAGILGPIKNKPIELADGTLVCPSSTEEPGLHLRARGWRVVVERTSDLGATWQSSGPLNDSDAFDAIQPAILTHPDGRLQLLCRSNAGVITQVWSHDDGRGWEPMRATTLPNPGSGIDALTLRDGRHLLVYNHCTSGRDVLDVAVSSDGLTWQAALVLEDGSGEFSYPAVIQSADGLVHLVYTWRRERIRHVVLDPARLVLRPISDGRWPATVERP